MKTPSMLTSSPSSGLHRSWHNRNSVIRKVICVCHCCIRLTDMICFLFCFPNQGLCIHRYLFGEQPDPKSKFQVEVTSVQQIESKNPHESRMLHSSKLDVFHRYCTPSSRGGVHSGFPEQRFSQRIPRSTGLCNVAITALARSAQAGRSEGIQVLESQVERVRVISHGLEEENPHNSRHGKT